jgi:SAM-dependent methyltransferase
MKINEKGFWMNETQEGHANDEGLSLALINLVEKLGVKSILDLGCGPGFYLSKFKAAGYICDGFDGNPYTEQLTQGLAKVADLSKEFFLNIEYDCVLSLEVGEHIPKVYEQAFIDNVCRHANKYVILSWAVPGQHGDGHVNCQTNEYIASVLLSRGFKRITTHEEELRKKSNFPWFKNTLMVYTREQVASNS